MMLGLVSIYVNGVGGMSKEDEFMICTCKFGMLQ